jgi:hypothetical protein
MEQEVKSFFGFFIFIFVSILGLRSTSYLLCFVYLLLPNIALSLEELNKVTHIFCLDESHELAILGHRHECISFTDTEHISDILWDDDLPFGAYCDRSVHLDTD